ncbi:MAG: 30S ribosome-binding factor RbfA [bacterium]|nr:30S ribosome-binding factor RbfA [bacterium]
MPRRIEQLNEQLKNELANLIVKELPLDGGLITVSYVKCSPDLKYAKIAISVLPEKYAGTALAGLRKNNSNFSQSLKQKLKIRQIPRFNWTLDTTESKAAEIEKVFKQIREEEKL